MESVTDEQLEDMINAIRSYLVVSNEILLQDAEKRTIPFAQFCDTLEQFFIEKVGCQIRRGSKGPLVSYSSAKSNHIRNLIDGQKHSGRSKASYHSISRAQTGSQFPTETRYNYLPPRPASDAVYGNKHPEAVSQGCSVRASSLSYPSKTKSLSAIDVTAMLLKINKKLAGCELSLDEYFSKVEAANGNKPVQYLRKQFASNNEIMRFIANNSNKENPVEITQLGRLKINHQPQRSEILSSNIACRSSSRSSEAEDECYTYRDDFPYSTAFKHVGISDQKEIDAVVGSFTAHHDIQFYFTTVDEANQRDALLCRLNNDLKRKPDRGLKKAYEGMPCLARDDWSNSNQYQRAVVIKERDKNHVEVFFVDNGSKCETTLEVLREIPTEFLSDHVYSHPGIVGLIKPCNGKSTFQIHIAQHLAALDGDIVRIKVLRYSDSFHVVDFGDLLTSLVNKGLVERDATRTSVMAKVAAKSITAPYDVRVEVLPNMNYIFILKRYMAEACDVLVPTACLSKMLGLKSDSLLQDLEKEAFITVSEDRLMKEENNVELYRQLIELSCPLLNSARQIVLIPINSVIPLLKAHEAALPKSHALVSPKRTYKFLVGLFEEYKDQL
ncbi:hypothetical protein BIW11_05693 [Tropilaelaps mercedesae]|uniref:Tudor domain-containing protein n=1 Tax=Tropilaelaps mercedesae TaxID=418985 RepID=A0A1V9Y1C9_9ACAR|nr:hypothetical protein BIW11_05693 [Tropilaelaps mercedesae]